METPAGYGMRRARMEQGEKGNGERPKSEGAGAPSGFGPSRGGLRQ